MKKAFRIVSVPIMIFTMGGMVGCASKYEVTFDSNPQGATLICNGQNWGYTPKKLYYDESVKNQPYINVSNCSANWSSGAQANYPYNLKVYPEGGTIITLPRPNVSGYAQDAEFALKVQNMYSQQSQAYAAQRQAQAAENANNKTTNCITNYGFTTCY